MNRTEMRTIFAAGVPWGLLIGSALIVRYVIDTLAPVADYSFRASILSYALIPPFMIAATRWGWRSGNLSSAVLVAVTAGIVGGLVSLVGAGILLVTRHDPATLQAWRAAGGLDETFITIPFDLFCIGIILGTAGGVCGKYARLIFKHRPNP
jgi:hypothetical protein